MSFGGGGFGGFGQQNQTSSFGGFGQNNNNTSFGSSSTLFGGNNNQNTGSGLFGGNSGTSSGFGTTGAFGNSTSAFGSKPAFGATTTAGTSLFGSTTATASPSAFGGGSAFGKTTSSPFGGGGGTGLFGSSKPAFGTATTGGGLFGSTNNNTTTTTGFGASGGFGATSNPGLGTNIGAPPGTNTVPFAPFVEKENNNTSQQNSFQNILFMDAYKKWSGDELRLADYNQGRRFGNSTGTGAFGVSSGFGGFGNNNNTTTNTTGGGLFGNNNTTTNAFGQTNTTGGFGSNNNTTGNSLFGKPAGTGGLFGSTTQNNTTTGGGLFGNTGNNAFGTNTNTGFGSATTNNTTGGLFGSTATQNKPATGGFGFGTGTTGGGFGNTGTGAFGSTAGTTTGGLFGNANNNNATTNTTGGGLFSGTTLGGASTNAFGNTNTTTTNAFGAQNNAGGGLFGQKPAGGGLFGTTTNTATNNAAGGGLFGAANTGSAFGTNNQQAAGGGLFGAKPATTTTGGGLFGNAANTTNTAGGGGLFGNALGQSVQNQQQQQPAAQQSLFGNALGQNQQKPSLFGAAAPAAGGGSLFGGQAATQQAGNSLFGQPAALQQQQQQQGNGLGTSLFGNTQAGGNGAALPALTTSIADAGAYGAPSLFQNLAASEVNNPGPLATPLSANKAKTSRRSSILPLYKMNPSSASGFATPQKRGYGFSYSTFGTPNSASSTASTPAGGLGQSLLLGGSVGAGLGGSMGRSLGKSMSSSNLRRTYNAEDSILLPGAFSSSSGPRFYGSSGGGKKLVINREMRSDLFSTPSKVKDKSVAMTTTTSAEADGFVGGGPRKLTKRVSFDTAISRNGDSDGDLGYLRPQSRGSSSNGTSGGSSSSQAETGNVSSGSPVTPEVEVTGKELAIVHEEDSSNNVSAPLSNGPRCIPANYAINNKELGEYWMSPSKDEIERMNRVQRQQVANFTVGRMNAGQIRFRVPVDLTKIDLDAILDGIVVLVIRSATVYPKAETKPPVGQGLNVPAEILLLHTCPRSGADVSAIKMKKHIQRLKAIPNTSFVGYNEKTAAWTFTVEHFTTYGLDDDDDDETDGETVGSMGGDKLEKLEKTPIGAGVVIPQTRSSPMDDDDTFEFRRRKRVVVPGAFDEEEEEADEIDAEEEPSFLSNRSAEMRSPVVAEQKQQQDLEWTQDGLLEKEDEATLSLQQHPAAEHDNNSLLGFDYDAPMPTVPETPAGVMRARLQAIKESTMPLTVQVADGDNWMEMLQKTVSPQKRDRAALRAAKEEDEIEDNERHPLQESTAGWNLNKSLNKSAFKTTMTKTTKTTNDNRGFATSIDLMNSLFEKAKAPSAPAVQPITPATGFMKWPYKRQETTNDTINETEQAFHNAVRPAWSADGTCIVPEPHDDIDTDTDAAPALKRVRVFDTTGLHLQDLLEGLEDHKDAVDIEVVHGVPHASTKRIPACKAFASFCEQTNRQKASTAPSWSKQLGAYEQSVWELASVLFDGEEEEKSSKEDKNAEYRRLERLRKFWASLVEDASTKALELAPSMEERAVVQLAGHNVSGACRSLVDSKNYKAATLVSLIGTSDAFQRDMREQLDDWQKDDTLSEFGVPLRAIYSLLAGRVAVCEGSKKGGGGVENRIETVVLSEHFHLDWKQAFGLRLWYGTSSSGQQGIRDAVAGFVEDVEQGRVPLPRPWYDANNSNNLPIAWSDPKSETREDLLFGLLKVAAGLSRLDEVLEPENAQLSPFHFRLCWQLNQALTASSGIPAEVKLSEAEADALTSMYAAEVVYEGDNETQNETSEASQSESWIHAVWIHLHLSQPAARTRAIQDVLGRHAGRLFRPADPDASSRLYDVLVGDLKIPAVWVWQAAALYWRDQQDQPALEAACLLRAAAYGEAHQLFVQELAPRAVVERRYDDLAALLAQLQPHRHQIGSAWSLGGEVYSRFLELLGLQGVVKKSPVQNTHNTRARQQPPSVEQRAQAVEALVSSLPSLYERASDSGPTEVAAITEMADVVAQETMDLASKGRMDLTKIARLPLTEDRRLRYSTNLAFAYYREVMSA